MQYMSLDIIKYGTFIELSVEGRVLRQEKTKNSSEDLKDKKKERTKERKKERKKERNYI